MADAQKDSTEKGKGDKLSSGEGAIDAVNKCREIMEKRRQERLAAPHCVNCQERDPVKLLQFNKADGTSVHWCAMCMTDRPKLCDSANPAHLS